MLPRSPRVTLLARGVLCAVIAICFCFGGALIVYRTAMLAIAGVRGQAIVTQYLREVPVRRGALSWTNHLHVVEFNGRTLERQFDQRLPVGTTLGAEYVPNSNNITFDIDNESRTINMIGGLLMVLFGTLMGIVA